MSDISEHSEEPEEYAFDAIENAKPTADNFIELPLIEVRDEVILPHTITPLAFDFRESTSEAAAREALEKRQTAIHVRQDTEKAAKSLKDPSEAMGTEVALIDISDGQLTLLMAQGRRRPR
jgi:hypothetical protein